MAKKKAPRNKKKLTFQDIIKGNFLNREEVQGHYKFSLLVLGLVLIIIYMNHLGESKIGKINSLKEQMEEYKSRNAFAQSRLIKVKMESQLGKEMAKDSLLPLENHPHKLLIKIDSINGKSIK